MDKKKVLILYASLGAGHGAAAKAIAEVFALKYPEVEIKNIDVLDFVFEILKKSLWLGYFYLVFRAPLLWRWIYDYYNERGHLNSANNISNLILKKSHFVKMIKDFDPDFIISTNPFPTQLMSKTKEKNIINIPSANVCTDFGFHILWHNQDVNYYFVENDEIKNSLIDHGVDQKKIYTTGIPTSLKFGKLLDKKEIIEKLGFDENRPILLIVGGNTSCKKIIRIVNNLKKKNNRIQFIVVAGRDKILHKKLEISKIKGDSSVRIFGFVDNLDEYISAADLILTKAGGLTVSECLVKGLPMVVIDIIAGQEEDNANYIVKEGAGIALSKADNYAEVLNNLLSNPERLKKMKENCKRIAKPNAAINVADFVFSKITFGALEPKNLA